VCCSVLQCVAISPFLGGRLHLEILHLIKNDSSSKSEDEAFLISRPRVD